MSVRNSYVQLRSSSIGWVMPALKRRSIWHAFFSEEHPYPRSHGFCPSDDEHERLFRLPTDLAFGNLETTVPS